VVRYSFFLFLLLSIDVMASGEPLVDPTQPLNYRAKAVSVEKKQRPALPKLQSILLSGEQRKAIVNNQLYTAGEKVNGYLITRIDKNTVLLRYNNRTYQLTLYTKKERFIE
jgi:MSHA biogenesis protein MshK